MFLPTKLTVLVRYCVFQAIAAKKAEVAKVYGFCIMDGHKEKIGNFNIEPPGLFRGRGDHPKQGMLKRRVMPEDVIINCSRLVHSTARCISYRVIDRA